MSPLFYLPPGVSPAGGAGSLPTGAGGGIGYWNAANDPATATRVLVSFREPAGMPYGDSAGGLDELTPPAGCTSPARTNGPIDFAAVFSPTTSTGVQAKDLASGATALPRDLTVSAIMTWNFDAQNTAGTPGTVIARGLGTGATEYMPFAIELYVVNFAQRIGGVRFLWHTAAGVLKTEVGGTFSAPAGGFMFTATRRWISPTSAVIRYYINDQLLVEVATADGDIASSVTGSTTVGTRYIGAAYGNFLAGAIDELLVCNYEMSLAEIAATWVRIAIEQPDGYRVIRDLMPPGAPISDDPASRAQGDLASIGVGLGFASGQIENFRQNIMPDRAYGDVLRRWEGITRQPPKQGDSLDRRRSRVVGHMKSRAGVSVPGVEAALADVLNCNADNLQVFAFDNTIRDTFATLNSLVWWTPHGGVDVIGSELRISAAAGSYPWDVANYAGLHASIAVESPRPVANPFNGIRMMSAFDPVTLPANAEAGIVVWDWAAQSMIFFGVRNAAGVYQLGYQRYRAGVAIDAAWQVLATPALVKTWLRIAPAADQTGVATADQKYALSYSTVGSLEAQLTTAPAITWTRAGNLYAGHYLRTFAATAGATDVRFTSADFALRNDFGSRPFYFYVFRDPALGGSPDFIGADRILQRMKHAFTNACAIASKSALFDDPGSTFDCSPLGCI